MKRLATIPDKGEKSGAFTSWRREAHYDRESGKYVNWHANDDCCGFVDEDGRIIS